ncbi:TRANSCRIPTION FACTOR BHLH30 [Salix purpurea]|uniref:TRANSCRIPTION FACTOR BHLH30 n=1 Tax=Salix purpurea TaxID=77065 RepID=A0A9Q0PD94_SALPP|nr:TRANSCRIPTION FACTOR BHLH30 [Salix purpurea]
MHPFQSFCYLNQDGHVPEPSLVNMMDGRESILSSASKTKAIISTESSCKSHKETERRRRQRINAHLSTLRTLLPSPAKTDKASLLAQVVHHVRDLKMKAAGAARQYSNDCSSGLEPEENWPYPGEVDEATLSCCGHEEKMIKVSVCCEDRPGLNMDLTQAIKSVRAKAVRAEMMTVAGRTKTVVVMRWDSGSGGEEDVGILKRALNAVVENRAPGSGSGQVVQGNKRARVFGLVSDVDRDRI